MVLGLKIGPSAVSVMPATVMLPDAFPVYSLGGKRHGK